MHRKAIAPAVCMLAAAHGTPAFAQQALAYPPAPGGDVATDYFGTTVADPYRWMEDVDSTQTRTWVAAEQHLTESYLAAVPHRERIRGELRALWDYEKLSLPERRAGVYITRRNSGLQNQAVLYVSRGLNGTPHVLLDPNTLSDDGTAAVGATALSRDGRWLAYATQVAGSDWQTWHVRDVASGRDLPDRIEWSRFSGASWAKDGAGFYYSAYDRPASGEAFKTLALDQKVFFHRLGTAQSADVLVYRRPDHPDWTLDGQVTEDGRYLVITADSGSDPYNRIFYQDLTVRGAPIRGLIPDGHAIYNVAGNQGTRFFLQTDRDAPRGRVVAIDVRTPERVEPVIAEDSSAMQTVTRVGDHFFVAYLEDAHSVVKVFDLHGTFVREVALPGLGSVNGFDGAPDDRDTFYSYVSFTEPRENYRYDLATGASELVWRPSVPFDGSAYVSEQVFCTSKDGTRIPVFVSYRRGLARDGNAPAILYGYGGFDIPMTPNFSPSVAEWLSMGGVYALAVLRGGSEYGEAWHRAGWREHKQNVFDDFIASAQFLIDQKYTSTPKLAIKGDSNGGLLVGAALTQRPDLFGAALPGVGVMDMLRFDQFTAGKFWVSEYGSAEVDKAQFDTLYRYSPVQNIKPGTVYPATLISTADHEDRVYPAHSFKFAATLQRGQAGTAPILLRVETRAGHGAGKPTAKVIDEDADTYAFLTRALHMTEPEAGSLVP